MATPAQIDAVKLQLPDEAEAFGIDDAVIDAQFNLGLSQSRVILFALRAIAAKSASLEDISESGSSRTQRLNERVLELIRDWTAVADKEDLATGTIAKEGARIYTAVRV